MPKIQPKISEQIIQQPKTETKAPSKAPVTPDVKAAATPAKDGMAVGSQANALTAAIHSANNNPPALGALRHPTGSHTLTKAEIDHKIDQAISGAKYNIFRLFEGDASSKNKIEDLAESLSGKYPNYKGNPNYTADHAIKLAQAMSNYDSSPRQASTYKHTEAAEILINFSRADLNTKHSPAHNLATATKLSAALAQHCRNPSNKTEGTPPGDLILNYHNEMYEHSDYTPAMADKLIQLLEPYDVTGGHKALVNSTRP